jgi:alkylmercury lyase
MNSTSLQTLATHLADLLHCIQDATCQQIMQTIVETGQPLAPAQLANHLQMSDEQLKTQLAQIPDTEFDQQDNIIGWGITLAPTQHQFQVNEHHLFTWCAFDTVLFPPLLKVEATVQGKCSTTGQPVTFQSMAEGIEELAPATTVLSLNLPEPNMQVKSVRGIFCQQSLFFQSEEAALPWMESHPGAVLLSLQDATKLGQLIAQKLNRNLVEKA